MSEDDHLERLTERAYQLRIAAGCSPRNARLGAIVDAIRAQKFIRPRDPGADDQADVGEGQR